MPETSAGTYATLANVEIINNQRTLTYLQNGLGPGSLTVHGDCGNCENILELLNCPGITGYIDPETDVAPWFSPTIPESKEFLGLFVDEFDGLSSPFTRDVSETVNNGGILNRSRLSTRSMTWRGFLFGGTCCGTYYGLRWLSKTLSRFDANCRDCFGDDLELLVCCPCEGQSGIEAFRTLKGVGLLEGPVIQSQRKTLSSGCTTAGCSGSCIIEVEFTLVATQPYLYSEEVAVYDCVSLGLNGVTPVTNAEEPCGPFDCSDAILEANCPSPEVPPAATYQNSCLTDVELNLTRALYLTIPRIVWPDLEEVVPVITIDNNSGFALTGVKIGFYTSDSNNPCGDLLENPPECAALCDELVIGYIPGQSSFYIDGRTRKMALICDNNNTAFPGERHTNGPWSWPTFNSEGFCMEIQFVDEPQADDVCVSLSLIPRSF